MNIATGRCLCGAVTIKVPQANTHDVSVCHCGMCRQWGGGPLMSVECEQDVVIEGESNIQRYRSSEWAERAFCRTCGTHLFYQLVGTHTYELSAGLFPEGEKRLVNQIYIDLKPTFYSFTQHTPTMTEQQVIEQYAGS